MEILGQNYDILNLLFCQFMRLIYDFMGVGSEDLGGQLMIINEIDLLELFYIFKFEIVYLEYYKCQSIIQLITCFFFFLKSDILKICCKLNVKEVNINYYGKLFVIL